MAAPSGEPRPSAGIDIVKSYLRAQNLEQLGRIDEAIELYEGAAAAAFDSTGPYDRLIEIYSQRHQHEDVERIAAAALHHVRTHDEKRQWYASMRIAAERASRNVPGSAPRPGA